MAEDHIDLGTGGTALRGGETSARYQGKGAEREEEAYLNGEHEANLKEDGDE